MKVKVTTVLKSLGTLIAGAVAEEALVEALSPINTILFGLAALFLITLAYELEKDAMVEKYKAKKIAAFPS